MFLRLYKSRHRFILSKFVFEHQHKRNNFLHSTNILLSNTRVLYRFYLKLLINFKGMASIINSILKN